MRAESNAPSSRMVEVAQGVSLRVIEAGKPGDRTCHWFSFPAGAQARIFGVVKSTTFAKTHRVSRVRSAFGGRIDEDDKRQHTGNTCAGFTRVAGTPRRAATCSHWVVARRSGHRRLCRAVRHQRSRGNCAGGCGSFRWRRRHGRAIRRKQRSNSKCSPFTKRIRRNIWAA